MDSSADLTAKARIRGAALELFGAKGMAGTTIREVATAAGVTHGLVVHHFVNKNGLQEAVRQHVVGLVRQALAAVPAKGSPAQVRRARDASVDRMFTASPQVLNYLRRALLDPAETDTELIATLAEFTLAEVRELRPRGVAANGTKDYVQAMAVMTRVLGPRLLAPVTELFWNHLTGGTAGQAPEIAVVVQKQTPGRARDR